jgi:hypothetical protein
MNGPAAKNAKRISRNDDSATVRKRRKKLV